MSINIEDLDPETRKRLGITKPRRTTFTKEDVRSNAIRVLHTIASLTQQQRARVLSHAVSLNRV